MSFVIQNSTVRVGPGVVLGDRVWMTKNLDVTTYRNGDVIPQVTSISTWGSLTTGAWCWYGNNQASGSLYGRLYNSYAVADPRGLAPQGWRIPTPQDWTSLFQYIDPSYVYDPNNGNAPIANVQLKSPGTQYWFAASGSNTIGFNALGAGYRYYFQIVTGDNGFAEEKTRAWFYVSNKEMITLSNTGTTVTVWPTGILNPRLGLSVRCVKDT